MLNLVTSYHLLNTLRLVVAGLLLDRVEVLHAGPCGLPAAGCRLPAGGAGVAVPGPGSRPPAVPPSLLFLLPALLNLWEISHTRSLARSSELGINLCCVILLSLRIPLLRTFSWTARFPETNVLLFTFLV